MPSQSAQALRHCLKVVFSSAEKKDASIIIRRMPKCNTVLQNENDLFVPEIQPNSHGNCESLFVCHFKNDS